MRTAAIGPTPPIETVKLPAEGFVRLPLVLTVYPVSRRTWSRGVRAGRYPQPVKLSFGVTGWRVEDIRALIARRSGGQEAATR